MKAIIMAAGIGSRLRPFTEGIPKCMVDVGGKTILQRILDTFNKCGVTDISVIRGYKKEKIDYPLTYYDNPDFKNTEQLRSLFCAESEMDGEFIVSFSDILFSKDVLDKLLEDKSDIAIVIDTDWKSNYKDRTQHPMDQADKVIIENGKITKLGKHIGSDKAAGEFIGLAKFSDNGAKILKASHNKSKEMFAGKHFHGASSFEKAYIYDMIQELVNNGHDVTPILIEGGWMEIDTCEDLENARKRLETF